MAAKDDRVRLVRPGHPGQWDRREPMDFLDREECLGDGDLLVTKVLMATVEYPVDMPASTSPSNLFLCLWSVSFLLLIYSYVALLFPNVILMLYFKFYLTAKKLNNIFDRMLCDCILS